MGLHVQLSGAALRYYSTIGVDWHQMLTWVKKFKGRTSRVDLAIDLHNSGLKRDDFVEENLKPYKGKGRTPRFVPMGTIRRGFTVYIGSRTSAKFLRIYDKAKEQKDATSDYIRVELECKREIAHAIGWEFPTMGQSTCVEMAQTLIRNVADFNLAAWDVAMLSRDVGLSIPQGKEKDTLGWLVKICAPALAKQIAKNPNKDVMGWFTHALRSELQLKGLDIQ